MFDVTLRDGTPAIVLPLRREDRERLVEGFEELSDEARRQRFLTPTAHLSESMLNHLVDDVDFIDHVAFVLAVANPEDPQTFDPVAIGRMVRYEDVPEAADVAVTVKDAHQGRGIASALLEVLADQRPEGVTRVVTEVVAGNAASLAMLQRLGPTKVEANGYGAYDVEVELWVAGAVAPEADEAPAELPSAGIPLARPRSSEEHRRRPSIDRRRQQALQARDTVCPWLTPA
ncbi:GNAT family N-acetyltransferase [Nocardioides yefusunii]|uniref:GNAT family N-acetyltransferase n=1 Tax=Nocardioides yefusunii TaxID=2500546 RepID=A0ABW1R0D6_9ACTN|nr:GNAT family N-acetyltransferase [Nocardioides yefusunii]